MKRKALFGCGVILCIIPLVLFAAYKMALPYLVVDIFDVPPSLLKTQSPANFGTAAFLRDEAFSNYSVHFYVFSNTKDSQPLLIGGPYSSDGNYKLRNAIWSKDGSVIAVRAKVGQSAGHGFSKYFGEFYVDAYDFRNLEAVAVGDPVRQKDKRIGKLISQRGGRGKAALQSPNDLLDGQQISEQEALQFKRAE